MTSIVSSSAATDSARSPVPSGEESSTTRIRWSLPVRRGSPPKGGMARNWSQEPHHRRRRGLALLLFGAAAIIILIAVASSGGGATPHPAATSAASFFGRIQTLAGGGSGSFAGNELA